MIPSIMSPRGTDVSRTSRTLAICSAFASSVVDIGALYYVSIFRRRRRRENHARSSSDLTVCGSICSQEKQEFPSTSGNAYLRECSVIEKDMNDLTQPDMKYLFSCIAYTEGVLDGIQAEDAFQKVTAGKSQTAPFCVPDAADNGQIIRITLKYIRNNPEEAHQRTAVLILEALREAFPCVAQAAKK